MGMIANYQPITNDELEELKKQDDLYEYVEDLQDDENLDICDIDKMWDALHFLLTGKPSCMPIENDLLSEAIVGQFTVSEEDEEFISYTQADRVMEIAEALKKVDIEKYISKFNMNEYSKNDIYPNIWGHKGEEDEIKDDLRGYFASLENFYARTANKGCGVLVSIY